ncbi:MAG: hypothetical protein ACYC4L_03125 [Chloroflexota bacterium]
MARNSAGWAGTRGGVGRRESVLVTSLVASLLVLTSVPYVFAYLSSPADKQFMGILLNVPDNAQYLSWARESSHSILIENKLTPERGEALFFNLFWLVVGRLALFQGLSPVEALHEVRLVASAAYLVAIYWFVGLLLTERLQRWVAFLVIGLGGGLGGLLVVAKQVTGSLAYPLDLYVTEANTFLTVMAFPHQSMAGALIVLVLGLSALAFERQCLRTALLAGLLALVLGLQHGYDLIIIYAVVGTVALVLTWRGWPRWRPLLLAAVVCLPSFPAALYMAYITRESPIWRGVLAQYGNAGVYTPAPAHLVVLMGIPLLLVLAGRGDPKVLAAASPRELILRAWLVLGFFLLYIPTDFQIKMLAAWQVPVGVVAVGVAFAQVMPLLRRPSVPLAWQRPAVLGALLVAVVLPTNLYLFAWRFVDLARHDYPYYLHRDEVAAMRWLDARAQPSDVVLSSLTLGQYVPSVAGNTAFLAHWAQTLDYYEKRRLVDDFFDPSQMDSSRVELLSRFGVRYVLLGVAEGPSVGAALERSGMMKVDALPHAAVYQTSLRGQFEEAGQ